MIHRWLERRWVRWLTALLVACGITLCVIYQMDDPIPRGMSDLLVAVYSLFLMIAVSPIVVLMIFVVREPSASWFYIALMLWNVIVWFVIGCVSLGWLRKRVGIAVGE